MKFLVLLTAQVNTYGNQGTAQIRRTVEADARTVTRNLLLDHALAEAGLSGLRTDQMVITFFYAEPDEIRNGDDR